jgi:K+-transporting ATPase A subunit
MMINTDITQLLAFYLLTLAIAIPLGAYIARVFSASSFSKAERVIYKLCSIDPQRERYPVRK